jgi:phosphoserine phosphatase
MTDPLPSWRAGAARDAVEAFLDAAPGIPPAERLAVFDNDGTLWAEKPSYVQFDFFLEELKAQVGADPSLAERAEFAALLSGDAGRIAEVGLPAIAMALASLFEGESPEAFAAKARAFVAGASNGGNGRPVSACRYQPMLELIAALRALDFTVAVVSGGGTEFVRAISADFYGVAPELVVGTLVEYEYGREPGSGGDDGAPRLRRTAGIVGGANEGPVKVTNIQTQLGRRPVFAAGNSAGDREMLEWAQATPGPSLALLVDHDDAEREFAYASEAGTFTADEAITDVGHRLGWTVVSMKDDWATVFSSEDGAAG